MMAAVKAPPESTKHSLRVRLNNHAATHWPTVASVDVRFRTNFAYIDAVDSHGEVIKLCRLRYGGSAHYWGFAIYRSSHDDYQDSYLPTAAPLGTPEDALGCAAMLYLDHPTHTPPNTPTN